MNGRGLVIGALLLTTAVAFLLGGRRGVGSPDPDSHPGSTYDIGRSGAKATYRLLERLGHRVERRAEPLGDPGAARLLFMLAPASPVAGSDLQALVAWIERGGTLVYGALPFEPDQVRVREALGLKDLKVLPQAARTVTLTPDHAPARTLLLASRATLGSDDRKDLPAGVTALAVSDGEPWALQVARGAGRILIIDPGVVSTGRLRDADNALFVAAVAARFAAGSTVVFDEFSHGFHDFASIRPFRTGPAWLAAFLGGVALLLHALGVGRRFGPPSDEPLPSRRASLEQITALARFYASRRNRAAALRALGVAPPAKVRSDAQMVSLARAALERSR